jgi:putrescine transport system substrate-binding protein
MNPTCRIGGPVVACLALLAACSRDPGIPQGVTAPPSAGKLHIYNSADYIGESTIADFEKRTGIEVTYDVYDSNEVLETKLLTGHSGYDIVVPSGVFVAKLLPTGVFETLDKSKLPYLGNLDSDVMRRAASHDPGNDHSVPYLWGTTGIGYNVDKVQKALGTTSIDSLAAIFDPANAARLASCGIALLDSPGDMFALAKIYVGADMNSERQQDMDAAAAALNRIRPYVRYFDSARYVEDLASGEICIAIGWTNGVSQARTRGARSSTPVTVKYVVPREGAPVWYDLITILADAPDKDNAYAFFNYLMEPEVMAGVTNAVGEANANTASTPFVKSDIRNDASVYITPQVRARLKTFAAYSPEYFRRMNRSWTLVRTGQ